MIKGFRGTSLVDYPEKIASVIYTYGCNFRCPYCYNIELVNPEYYRELPDLSEEEILAKLSKRKNFIQGVVISGGEPTIWDRKLRFFMERLKYELDLPIKLDTNGSKPDLLENLFKDDLIDFLALDFKTTPKRYEELGGKAEIIKETLSLLKNYAEKVEIRITLYPPLVTPEDFEEMLPYLQGFTRVALQKYLPEKNLSGKGVSPYSEEESLYFLEKLKNFFPEIKIYNRL